MRAVVEDIDLAYNSQRFLSLMDAAIGIIATFLKSRPQIFFSNQGSGYFRVTLIMSENYWLLIKHAHFFWCVITLTMSGPYLQNTKIIWFTASYAHMWWEFGKVYCYGPRC